MSIISSVFSHFDSGLYIRSHYSKNRSKLTLKLCMLHLIIALLFSVVDMTISSHLNNSECTLEHNSSYPEC